MPESSSSAPTIVLVRDLLFVSKITAAARAAGAELTVVREPAALAQQVGRRLIVDLNLPGAVSAAAQWKDRTSGEVIGFVAHTDAATIQQARSAGLDQILPRSRFVEILSGLFSPG